MGVSVSRSAAEINLDELERRLRGASTEPESADDALIELARRLAPLHSSPHPQAVSEHGRPDTELTTQPLETAKLPPSNSEASNAPSTTAFVEKLARRLALLRPSPYPQAVSEHGRTAELTTQPLETAKLPPSNSEASNAPSTTAFVGVGAKQAFEFETHTYTIRSRDVPEAGNSGFRRWRWRAWRLSARFSRPGAASLACLRRPPSSPKPRVRPKCSRRAIGPSRFRAMPPQPPRTKACSRHPTRLPFPQNNRRALMQRLRKVTCLR